MASTKNLKVVPTTGTMPRLDTKKIPKAERANIGQLVFDAIQREFQNPEIRAEKSPPPLPQQSQQSSPFLARRSTSEWTPPPRS